MLRQLSHFAMKFGSIHATKGTRRAGPRTRSVRRGFRSRSFESLEPRVLLSTTVSPVLQYTAGSPIEGATSSLTRNPDDVTLNVETVGLSPGVYTISVVAFNNPELCNAHCKLDDNEPEEVNVSVIFGEGKVVDESGSATFAVQLDEGSAASVVSGPGIVDTDQAEIHFIIRAKGPMNPEQREEQLTTIDGGCPPSGCEDVQTGIHISPQVEVTVSPVDLIRHVNFPIFTTSSRLTRYDDRITMRIDTIELEPGAYTVWLVAFNRPENCDGGCGPDDLRREGVDASIMWGNVGQVVDESGLATFIARRNEGDTADTLFGPGIVDTYQAELHAIIRTHGPVIPELLEEQLTTLNGACPPNTCRDVQVTGHLPNQPPSPSLLISSFEATDTGFVVTFSTGLDANSLNLYDNESADLGPADVVLQGATTGLVTGSLVIDPSLQEVAFVKSGGPLVADTYTVTLRSASDGFKSRGGKPLEGAGNSAAADFESTFTVAPPAGNAIRIGIPDFVRGPGQAVNVPATGTTGIPLSISEGTNVRTADLRISYDPALLEITGATLGGRMPADATVVLDNATPGLASLRFSSSTPLTSGSQTIVNLQATVPLTNATRIYRNQQVIDLHTVTITDGNGNQFPVIDDDGLHVVTHFGDVSGNGRINASDAAQVARVAALLDIGFMSTPLADPVVLADISGNGRINAADASLLAQFAALIDVPEIPPIPAGVVLVAGGAPQGIDAAMLSFSTTSNDTANTANTTARVSDLASEGGGATPIYYPAVDAVMADLVDPSVRDSKAADSASRLEDAIDKLLSVFHQEWFDE